jgi:3-hydroxyisobutyrate dehydrogenase-like beta-hydroxyacid dehydrogenase
MIVSVIAGLADVYAMAHSLGISAVDAHSLFDTFNPAAGIAYRGGNMAKGDYRASFELSMARKDVALMIETAKGAPLALLPGVAARMDQLLARGFGDDDMGVLSVDAVKKAT